MREADGRKLERDREEGRDYQQGESLSSCDINLVTWL